MIQKLKFSEAKGLELKQKEASLTNTPAIELKSNQSNGAGTQLSIEMCTSNINKVVDSDVPWQCELIKKKICVLASYLIETCKLVTKIDNVFSQPDATAINPHPNQ